MVTGSKKPASRSVPEVHTIAADAPVFVISVAAQLAQMHPQTLRQYDRVGLVSPGRTTGGGRRYSAHDIEQLKEVQRLSQDDGVNLSGIKRIIELENEVAALRLRISELIGEVTEAHARGAAAEAAVHASYRRDLVPVRGTAIIPWRPSL